MPRLESAVDEAGDVQFRPFFLGDRFSISVLVIPGPNLRFVHFFVPLSLSRRVPFPCFFRSFDIL